MNHSNHPRLRIVWSNDASAAGNSCSFREPMQLSLQLDNNEYLIACIGETYLSGSVLSNLLSTLRPYYLLDLRTCPRFDMFGYSRKRAFADFERWGAKYFCLTTEEATKGVSDRVHALVAKLSRDSQSLTGPLIALVDTTETVDQLSRAIPKLNNGAENWSISVEGLPSQATTTPRIYAV